MKIGDQAQVRRSFSARDLAEYGALSGESLGTSTDQARFLPEPLVGALFSYLLGMELPGLGTNYLKQHTCWHTEARIGEMLTAQVEITRVRPDKHLVDLATSCSGEDGRPIATGRALVHVADVAEYAATNERSTDSANG